MRRNILFRAMLVISMFVISIPAYCGMVYVPNHIFKQWNNTTFSGEPCAVGQWTDIAWNMGSGGPTDGGCGQLTDNFSEEWTGYIKAPYTGTITFYSYTDDRGYLYITDPATGIETNVVNSVWDQESSGTYNMVQNTYYPFRYRFIEYNGGALYYLRWSYTGQTKINIPSGSFYHASSDCVQPDSFKGGFYDRNLWQGSDIGSVYMNAGGQAVSSSLTITAGGADIWGTRDYFHYVWQYISAENFDVQFSINNIPATNDWAKFGIMARSAEIGSFYNSKYFMTLAARAGNYNQQWRASVGGSAAGSASVGTYTPGTIGYVRLVKTGNSFVGYYSSNGSTWNPMGVTQTVDVGSHYLLGIAATSHNTSTNGSFTGQDFIVNGNSCPAYTSTVTVTPTITMTATVTRTITPTFTPTATWPACSAVDYVASGFGSTAGGTGVSFSVSNTASSNSIMLIAVHKWPGSSVTNISYGGTSATYLTATGAVNNCALALYYINNPPLGSNTVSVTLGSGDYMIVDAAIYENTTGIGNINAGSSLNTGNTLSTSLSAQGNGDMIVGIAGIRACSVTMSWNAPMTLRNNPNLNTDRRVSISEFANATGGNTYTPGFTNNCIPSELLSIIGINLKAYSNCLTSTITPTVTRTITRTVTKTVTSTITPSVTASRTPTTTETVSCTSTATSTYTSTPQGRCSLDYMEDNDDINLFGGYWHTYKSISSTVSPAPESTFTMSSGGYDGSLYAARITGSVGTQTADYPMAGMSTQLNSAVVNGSVVDLSVCSGIRFYAKGNNEEYRVVIPYTDVNDDSLTGSSDYSVVFMATSEWTMIELPFGLFAQENWGVPVSLTEVLGGAKRIEFETAFYALTGTKSVDLWVDNVELFGCSACPIEAVTPSVTLTPTNTSTFTMTYTLSNTPTITQTIDPANRIIEVGVKYKNGTGDAGNINAEIRVYNTGDFTLNLSDLKIKYWYSYEGTGATETASVSFSKSDNGTTDILAYTGAAVSVVSLGTTDRSLDITFASGAGTLDAGEYVEIHCVVDNNETTGYTNTNDWSYKKYTTQFTDWGAISVYYIDEDIYGNQPFAADSFYVNMDFGGGGSTTALQDRLYVEGGWGSVGDLKKVTNYGLPIANTIDDNNYQSAVVSSPGLPVRYIYDRIPQGMYKLILKFAEIRPEIGIGNDVMNIYVEGQKVIENLDVMQVAGFAAAHDVEVIVDVLDGQLNIDFQGSNVTGGSIQSWINLTITPTQTTAVSHTVTSTFTETFTITNTFSPTVTPTNTRDCAQAWQYVGVRGISDGVAYYTSLYIDEISNTPYVAYCDGTNSNKATIAKFDGTNWVQTVLSQDNAQFTSLYIYNGVPYVAFLDGSTEGEGKFSVMKYKQDTDEWIYVGEQGFGPNSPIFITMYVSDETTNGVPYVSYQNGVYRYDESVNTWVLLGGTVYTGNQPLVNLSVSEGVPYVTYSEGVKKLSGSVWDIFGGGIVNSNLVYPSIYTYDDIVYIAYTDTTALGQGKISVKKGNSTSWSVIEENHFSDAAAYHTNIFVDNYTPYVSFLDTANSNKMTVMKHDLIKNEWQVVGDKGFSDGSVDSNSGNHNRMLYVNDGVPYVAFIDDGNGDKLSVMKYDCVPAGSTATYTLTPTITPTFTVTLIDSVYYDCQPHVVAMYEFEYDSSSTEVNKGVDKDLTGYHYDLQIVGSPLSAVDSGNVKSGTFSYKGNASNYAKLPKSLTDYLSTRPSWTIEWWGYTPANNESSVLRSTTGSFEYRHFWNGFSKSALYYVQWGYDQEIESIVAGRWVKYTLIYNSSNFWKIFMTIDGVDYVVRAEAGNPMESGSGWEVLLSDSGVTNIDSMVIYSDDIRNCLPTPTFTYTDTPVYTATSTYTITNTPTETETPVPLCYPGATPYLEYNFNDASNIYKSAIIRYNEAQSYAASDRNISIEENKMPGYAVKGFQIADLKLLREPYNTLVKVNSDVALEFEAYLDFEELEAETSIFYLFSGAYVGDPTDMEIFVEPQLTPTPGTAQLRVKYSSDDVSGYTEHLFAPMDEKGWYKFSLVWDNNRTFPFSVTVQKLCGQYLDNYTSATGENLHLSLGPSADNMAVFGRGDKFDGKIDNVKIWNCVDGTPTPYPTVTDGQKSNTCHEN